MMVLQAALETGGDYSELFYEDTESRNISMQNGSVENAAYSRSRGAGVRVLKGNNSAYAFTSDISAESLIRTAKAAAAAIGSNISTCQSFSFRVGSIPIEPKLPFSQIDNARRIELIKRATKAAQNYSAEITHVSARYLDVDQKVLICNSTGVFAQDRRPRTRISVEVVASNKTETQTGSESPGYGMGFEAYELIDPESAGKQAAATAVAMLHAPECPAGYFPTVINGGFGGVIFHEACGHSLEATAVGKGNSEFAGKLNEQIASPIVTAIDDGTMRGEWGSIFIDDEGTPSQRNVLIENGILKGYLIDLIGSRRLNMPVTGSSRRQGYELAPTSRMTNTYIAAGTDDDDEMIRSMPEGLLAARMAGGSVNPLTGEFNFSVREGYWIKNGQIQNPVRGATLVGKGADVLMHIDRIGKQMTMAQGMCGSASGSIPTNVGQPRIRVSEITIGGKGGKI